MASSNYDFSIIQGSSYNIRTVVKDSSSIAINLSGYSARGHVRYGYSNTGILLNLNPVIHNSYVSGIVTVSGTGESTSNLPAGRYVYDVEIYESGGYVLKILKGNFFINSESTFW